MSAATAKAEIHPFIACRGYLYQLVGTYPTLEAAQDHATLLKNNKMVKTIIKRIENPEACFAIYKANVMRKNGVL